MRHISLKSTAHRPWPLPGSPWIAAQTWSNLLFAHWRVPPVTLRKLIPDGLEVDTFEDEAWIGVVPFELRIRPRLLPVIPKLAAFPEINVRTYVVHEGKPGVWFFSLDATSPLAVRGARWAFSLPYFDAQISCTESEGSFSYDSKRSRAEVPANFTGRYQPASEVFFSEPGSLDAWLTERYCLYAANNAGELLRTEVHHAQWPLQKATCRIEENTMAAPVGVDLEGEPLLHFSKRVEVVNWAPHACSS